MHRLELQTILEGVLGSKHVYFQPPSTIKMVYPCIVYQRSASLTEFGNGHPYIINERYQMTLITRDPDDPRIQKLLQLPRCAHSTHFKVDGLNHDVFNIYF